MSLGMGLGSRAELTRVKAERAEVEAEIRRLQSGGRAIPGGFRVGVRRAEDLARIAPLPPPPSLTQKYALPGLVIGGGLAALLLWRRRK